MKSLRKVLNTFENIMENGAFAPMEQMLHFHNIQIYDISKALLWSKRLKLVQWYRHSHYSKMLMTDIA